MTVRKNAVAIDSALLFRQYLPQEGKLSTIEAAKAVFIETQQRKEAMSGRLIRSASACPPAGQRGGERIERFGGSSPVPLRVRDAAGKYAGDRKTERL